MTEAGRRAGQAALACVLAIGAIALVRDTAHNGQDFDVFWAAGRALLEGSSPYALSLGPGMVFKYPPWSVPFFVPFALLPLEAARWIWGTLQVLSLAAVIQWLRLRAGCGAREWVPGALAFWGLWVVHALDGQIALLMLAFVLWVSNLSARAVVLSTKVFTLFPLTPALFSRRAWRWIAPGLLACAVLATPVAWVTGGPGAALREWAGAASSGGSELTPGQVRGRINAGMPGLVLRVLGVPGDRALADIAVSLALALVAAVVWARAARRLRPEQAAAGWLALTPVIHPLPWWHLFVFAFPLAVMTLHETLGRRDRWGVALTVAGWILIAASTRKVLGPVGGWLELASAKSWGVLICAWTIARPPGRGAHR